MDLLILDPDVNAALIRQRRRAGLDRFDEVWDGVYVMSPLADDEHQELVGNLTSCFGAAIAAAGLGKVRPGVNISDRAEGWKHNYRCPDAVIFLSSTKAQNLGTHWLGGPDLAVEVVSHYDRSRQKIDFYAQVGTRELLIVDRYPWALELYRLSEGGTLDLAGRSTPEQPSILISQVLPMTFGWATSPGAERPQVLVTHRDDARSWVV